MKFIYFNVASVATLVLLSSVLKVDSQLFKEKKDQKWVVLCTLRQTFCDKAIPDATCFSGPSSRFSMDVAGCTPSIKGMTFVPLEQCQPAIVLISQI
jgi:hypothetical protein